MAGQNTQHILNAFDSVFFGFKTKLLISEHFSTISNMTDYNILKMHILNVSCGGLEVEQWSDNRTISASVGSNLHQVGLSIIPN